MAVIPEAVDNKQGIAYFQSCGLELVSSGKVRNTYQESPDSDWLIMEATDRLSIFDFVLPCLVPRKGEVLTALTIFWLEEVLGDIPNHLRASGWKIDNFLPIPMQGDPDLQSRALIVRRAKISPIECIVRGYLTGSGWRSYQKERTVCGHQLPEGLHDGSRLPVPIFTPTTKADAGHDTDVNADSIRTDFGWELEGLALTLYCRASEYSLSKGIILADTKFEFGEISQLSLCDEVLTPDSSRFWDVEEWNKASAEGKSPAGFDKEPVRQWGLTIETPFGVTGLNKLDTENPTHQAFVAGLEIPEEVIQATTTRYLEAFERLTGRNLDQFREQEMGVYV